MLNTSEHKTKSGSRASSREHKHPKGTHYYEVTGFGSNAAKSGQSQKRKGVSTSPIAMQQSQPLSARPSQTVTPTRLYPVKKYAGAVQGQETAERSHATATSKASHKRKLSANYKREKQRKMKRGEFVTAARQLQEVGNDPLALQAQPETWDTQGPSINLSVNSNHMNSAKAVAFQYQSFADTNMIAQIPQTQQQSQNLGSTLGGSLAQMSLGKHSLARGSVAQGSLGFAQKFEGATFDKRPSVQPTTQQQSANVSIIDRTSGTPDESMSIRVERVDELALFSREKMKELASSLKDRQLVADTISIPSLTEVKQRPSAPPVEIHRIPSHEHNPFIGKIETLQERKERLVYRIDENAADVKQLVQEVVDTSARILAIIEESRADIEKKSEMLDLINSSQYISHTSLVPSKQKVLKSKVAEVSKQHKLASNLNKSAIFTDGNSSEVGKILNQSSHPYLSPQLSAPFIPANTVLHFHRNSRPDVIQESPSELDQDDSLDCNVVDEEEEALDQLRALQTSHNNRMREQHALVMSKIGMLHEKVLSVTQLSQKMQATLAVQTDGERAVLTELDSEIAEMRGQTVAQHTRQEQVRLAWEAEIRQLNQVSSERAEQILRLQSLLYESNLAKNEATHNLKKNENEIAMLNQALEAYGYIKPAHHAHAQSSLDSLKEVLNENERLKDEMRTLIEAAVRDRQIIEFGQRETMQKLPDLMNQQYKHLIEEYGRKMSKEQATAHHQLSVSKKELDSQRDRVIKLIEEKSQLEQELNSVKLQKKEQAEMLKQKSRKVKELEIHLDVSKSKLDEANKKMEQKLTKVDELTHQSLPMKETISKQRQELAQLQIALSKTEKMREVLEKDLKEAIHQQRSLAVKVETLLLEKQELKQLVEMKSNFISGIHERNSLTASTTGVKLTDGHQQTLLYLETIQKLSMYIVRKSKQEGVDRSQDNSQLQQSTQLDIDTVSTIRGLMDEHVFDLLDKTESKVIQLQKENIELLEEMQGFFQGQLTTHEQVALVYELLGQILKVTEELMKSQSTAGDGESPSPLTRGCFTAEMPDSVVAVLSKVHSKRFDYEKQGKKITRDRSHIEQRIAKIDAQLTLVQSMQGQEWQDAIDPSTVSLQDKKEQVHGKLRAKLEREVNDLQILNEDLRLKYDFASQENNVLKKTVAKQKTKLKSQGKTASDVDWLQERLNNMHKRWNQLVEKLNTGVNQQKVQEFAMQVLSMDAKQIKKRPVSKQKSEDSGSFSQTSQIQKRSTSRSAITVPAKAALSEFNGQGYSDFEVQDRGTPLTKQIMHDELLYDESQNARKVSESPFNSPFQLHSQRPKLAPHNLVEEQAISAMQQSQPTASAPSPFFVPGDGQVGDLAAMIECQAFAIEDILRQKKTLQQQVKQSTTKKTLSKKKRQRSLTPVDFIREFDPRKAKGEDVGPDFTRKHSKIGSGVRHATNSIGRSLEERNTLFKPI